MTADATAQVADLMSRVGGNVHDILSDIKEAIDSDLDEFNKQLCAKYRCGLRVDVYLSLCCIRSRVPVLCSILQ